ncbi:MAG: sugar transferase [Nocardioides sp.]|nr:sugar transferase [Nocardioides sp.]
MDLAYVDNWSLGSDVKILLRTARAVVGHAGAY